MAIDSRFYMHDSDKIALQTLQAIPGFTQVFKSFMKVWDEKIYRVGNMSSHLQVSERQLSKYYDMLPPICEKLGIDIPELYITLDVQPNAWTAGDTKPFIVMTSGLFEAIPEELLPTVLAHECGHIACRHQLYTTMGRFVLNGAIKMLGLDGVAILPIQAAFFYWMRCSEFSADRAAALYDGSADNTIKLMMHLAGYDKDITGEASADEFMNQAIAYKEMVADTAWDKIAELMYMWDQDHPMTALRAYECSEWAKTDRFQKMANYIRSSGETGSVLDAIKELPMTEGAKFYIGKHVDDVAAKMGDMGFTDVRKVKAPQKGSLAKPGQVTDIIINGHSGFERYEWYDVDSAIEVEFYEPETEDEVAAAHPGQRRMPDSSKKYLNRIFSEAASELREAGFSDISLECQRKAKKNWLSKEGAISRISVNGQTQFEKGEWFPEDARIRIAYYSYASGEEMAPVE